MKNPISYNISKLLIITALFCIILLSTNLLLKRNEANEYNNNLMNMSSSQIKSVYAGERGHEQFGYPVNPSDHVTSDDSRNMNFDINNNEKYLTRFVSDGDKNGNDDIKYDNENSKSKLETKKGSDSDSDFNFVAVGDWDCKSETEDTVENIEEQEPELILALGDLSYNGKAKCWLEIIEPIAEKTKIVIGNHETDSSKTLSDYMDHFELEEQYYSFNYKNVHFLALSTETSFEEGSEQYEFAEEDLEKYSEDPSIDWIVALFHRQMYSSGGGPGADDDFRETYHPLFDKYNVDLAFQGHFHAYERLYPISFNHDDDDEPIIESDDAVSYENPRGTIFITAGTGGAHDMKLSSQAYYSAAAIDDEFGIVNIDIKDSGTRLTGSFIENNGDDDLGDQFQIIKEKNNN